MMRNGWIVLATMLGVALLAVMSPSAARAEDAEAVAVGDLPASVAEAAKKLCPGAEITAAKKEVDKDDQDQVVEMDFTLTLTLKSGKVHEAELDTKPDGTVKPAECDAKGPVGADDLPAAVADAVKKLCPDGKIASAERKARFRKDEVEAEYDVKLELAEGKAAEVRVRLLGADKVEDTRLTAPVAAADLPKCVIDVLKAACPNAEIASAEKRTEAVGEKVRAEYRLELKAADGKTVKADVRLADDGSLRRLEIQ